MAFVYIYKYNFCLPVPSKTWLETVARNSESHALQISVVGKYDSEVIWLYVWVCCLWQFIAIFQKNLWVHKDPSFRSTTQFKSLAPSLKYSSFCLVCCMVGISLQELIWNKFIFMVFVYLFFDNPNEMLTFYYFYCVNESLKLLDLLQFFLHVNSEDINRDKEWCFYIA